MPEGHLVQSCNYWRSVRYYFHDVPSLFTEELGSMSAASLVQCLRRLEKSPLTRGHLGSNMPLAEFGERPKPVDRIVFDEAAELDRGADHTGTPRNVVVML
jgi:hypothetical protein